MDSNNTYKHLFDADGDLTRETILAYTWGSLSEADRQQVDAHLAGCDMCRDAVGGMALMESFGRADDAIDVANANVDDLLKRRKRQLVPIWWKVGRIAAVIIVLCGAAVGVSQLIVGDTKDLAMLEDNEVSQPTIENDSYRNSDKFNFADSANDGTIETTVTGGTGAYTYEWENGSTVTMSPDFGAGTYTVTVNDASNCVTVNDAIVEETQNKERAPQPSESPVQINKQRKDEPVASSPAPTTTNIEFSNAKIDVVVANQEVETDKVTSAETAPAPVADELQGGGQDDLVESDVELVTVQSVTKNRSYGYVSDAGITQANTNAQYPGGVQKLNEYLNNFKPTVSFIFKPGMQITLSVEILSNGRVGKVTVKKGTEAAIDAEAINYIKKMPKWTAAVNNGKAVTETVELVIPIK